MLNSFIRTFDHSDFEKKLRHYFIDSAPINSDVVLGLREVHISCPPNLTGSCEIQENLGVKENIETIIDSCVHSLFPKMLVAGIEDAPLTEEQKKTLLMQGFSIEQIMGKEKKRTWVRYVIIRFNEHGSTIDYTEETTGARYRAHLYQPLMMVRDKIWKLASSGREGMEELYHYLMSISRQELLENDEAECSTQEF
jgi:hypothetical protein